MNATETLERGKLIPNWTIQDTQGDSHTLWDYRQKSHLIVIFEPDSASEKVQRWVSAVQADRRQWDWLNVKVLVAAKAPKDLLPGAYAIDRYGILIAHFPAAHWGFDQLEREFLYYEARHC